MMLVKGKRIALTQNMIENDKQTKSGSQSAETLLLLSSSLLVVVLVLVLVVLVVVVVLVHNITKT